MLEDDLHYFPPYEAAPVVRKDALEAYPQLGPALQELAGRIDTREMRALNRAVDVDGRDFREVVRGWIDSELGPNSGTRKSRSQAGPPHAERPDLGGPNGCFKGGTRLRLKVGLKAMKWHRS